MVAQSLLDGEAEALMARVAKLAKSVDGVVLCFCIGRLVPRKRPGSGTIEIDLPSEHKSRRLGGASAAMDAPARAELSIDEAADLVDRLEVLEQSARDRARGKGRRR